MKKLIFHFVMLVSMQTASANEVDQGQIEKAKNVFIGCLYTKADELDDATSDANTIAMSVAGACRTYGRAASRHILSDSDIASDPELRLQEDLMVQSVARTVVLKNRVDKRQKKR